MNHSAKTLNKKTLHILIDLKILFNSLHRVKYIFFIFISQKSVLICKGD